MPEWDGRRGTIGSAWEVIKGGRGARRCELAQRARKGTTYYYVGYDKKGQFQRKSVPSPILFEIGKGGITWRKKGRKRPIYSRSWVERGED